MTAEWTGQQLVKASHLHSFAPSRVLHRSAQYKTVRHLQSELHELTAKDLKGQYTVQASELFEA